ncbi:MAG: hypothetical protein OFPI_29790 [Osedax symbiont Rs2]|nr:MAG: hypothetical protein OFPI_29790 [Osedax symbiont Rs2]
MEKTFVIQRRRCRSILMTSQQLPALSACSCYLSTLLMILLFG